MLSLLVDNDVLIKCACYRLLDAVHGAAGSGAEVGILGAARFVVVGYLGRRGTIGDRPAALSAFNAYLSRVTQIEPDDAELRLAARIEEAATELGVDLDSGESQLCAIALARASPLVLTGDKRAIAGLEAALASVQGLASLEGRVVCLEQAIHGVVQRLGGQAVRTAVCAEPAVDKALSACFQCASGPEAPPFDDAGLRSYINSIRTDAPTVLYAFDQYA